jgi:hypothetical protein
MASTTLRGLAPIALLVCLCLSHPASGSTIVVPTVTISSLGHDSRVFSGVTVYDGVSFPCPALRGSCTSSGFSAAIATGDTIEMRFEAAPGLRFHVVRDPRFAGQHLILDTSWLTGANDAVPSTNSSTAVVFEGLTGFAPQLNSDHGSITPAGERIFLFEDFDVWQDFTFTAISVSFTVTSALPHVEKVYGSPTSPGLFGFYSWGIGSAGTPTTVNLMRLEPIPEPRTALLVAWGVTAMATARLRGRRIRASHSR